MQELSPNCDRATCNCHRRKENLIKGINRRNLCGDFIIPLTVHHRMCINLIDGHESIKEIPLPFDDGQPIQDCAVSDFVCMC